MNLRHPGYEPDEITTSPSRNLVSPPERTVRLVGGNRTHLFPLVDVRPCRSPVSFALLTTPQLLTEFTDRSLFLLTLYPGPIGTRMTTDQYAVCLQCKSLAVRTYYHNDVPGVTPATLRIIASGQLLFLTSHHCHEILARYPWDKLIILMFCVSYSVCSAKFQFAL